VASRRRAAGDCCRQWHNAVMHKVTKGYETALLPHFLPAIRLAFSHVGLFIWFMPLCFL